MADLAPSEKTAKANPYNSAYDVRLMDHKMHPLYSPQWPDLEDVMATIEVEEATLNLSLFSGFSDATFKTFRDNAYGAGNEAAVFAHLLPIIIPNNPHAYDILFNNLEHMTDGTIVRPKLHLYYGSPPERLAQPAIKHMSSYLIPSTVQDRPLAPNFFVEIKGPKGVPGVTFRQAQHNGAVGARAMHMLQNYGVDRPVFDNCPYAFTAVLNMRILELFAHHVTAPTTKGGQPQYHMTP
ncbi:hypothetical protein S40285_10134 [Stachybotrys chlorohalonatus IBT 40285]|uniref:Uncharacterized protein n=1 Tax=Stachybotrys chlorohalonatus (strain IBT 40285) TaxID=1283841 RepID=A0A084QTQ9_STAC4|nr:hypothetical protein S40285_10134 [Stachybotrys chlorohalonata IBT 40285]